jgi:hypothetical protein
MALEPSGGWTMGMARSAPEDVRSQVAANASDLRRSARRPRGKGGYGQVAALWWDGGSVKHADADPDSHPAAS